MTEYNMGAKYIFFFPSTLVPWRQLSVRQKKVSQSQFSNFRVTNQARKLKKRIC